MEDALANMMALMEQPLAVDQPPAPVYEDDIDEFIDIVKKIGTAKPRPVRVRGRIQDAAPLEIMPQFGPLPRNFLNILDPENRVRFENEQPFQETELFTAPITTTVTLEGGMSNVVFHERDLIHEVIPDDDIVMYRCNYGVVKYDGWEIPVKSKKTNRGRKKKEKVKKLRKKQGAGTDFNSQITFVIRSLDSPRIYKFKIFRTGKIQLPGVQPQFVDDVMDCTKRIAKVMNWHLHLGEQDEDKKTNLVELNPVMKNYKFAIKMPEGTILDLSCVKKHLTDLKNDPNPDQPSIFMIKYTRQDTKLSVKFNTPIPRKLNKKTRVNIFMRGKINILGAYDVNVTSQIIGLLHDIIGTRDDIIVPSGDYIPPVILPGTLRMEIPEFQPTIKDDEIFAILDLFK